MTFIRKDLSKGNIISNFLLKKKFKIFTKVLAKKLARDEGNLVVETQTCAITGRLIHDNFHLICYTLQRVGKTTGKGGALVHLD